MATETITIEIDAALAARLRAAGIEPAHYLTRTLMRLAEPLGGPSATTPQQNDRAQLKAELAEESAEHDRIIAEHGLWSDGLRLF